MVDLELVKEPFSMNSKKRITQIRGLDRESTRGSKVQGRVIHDGMIEGRKGNGGRRIPAYAMMLMDLPTRKSVMMGDTKEVFTIRQDILSILGCLSYPECL